MVEAYTRNVSKLESRCLRCSAFLLALLMISTGCSRVGTFPHSSGTEVDLTKKNFRVVKANAVGSSSGFALLGIIPFAQPSYTSAMSDLYDDAGIEEGTAQALVNVTQERSSLYLILFSIPRLTVRADIIEFVDDPPAERLYEGRRLHRDDFGHPRRRLGEQNPPSYFDRGY